MLFPRDLIEEIRVQNDIVEVIGSYVPLKQKGSSYFGLCPFHHEKSPSFSVDAQKQFYYCFGCGEAGNVYSFVMKMENCDFPQAVKHLAERVHVALPTKETTPKQAEAARLRKRLIDLHREAGRFYYTMLHSQEGKAALDYLNKRQILTPVQKKFGLGFAPSNRHCLLKHLIEKGFSNDEMLQSGLVMQSRDDNTQFYDRFYNRLMFPILDAQAQLIGFGGRILNKGEPKYLNSPETIIFNKSRNLFGLNLAKAAGKKEIILVEGYMDMISLYQAGFKNTVASLGTAFNQEHARTLKKYADSVILLYDSDDAGINAAVRAIPVLVQNGFEVKVLQVPSGKDPDDFVRENGAEEFGKLLLRAKSYISFEIDCIKRNFDLDNPQQKVRFTSEAAAILARLESDIERSVYMKELANITGIDYISIQNEVAKLMNIEDTRFLNEANAKRQEKFSAVNKSGVIPKGLKEAQMDVLNIAANHFNVYKKLTNILKSEDFTNEAYSQIYQVLGEIYNTGGVVVPGALISLCESPEEQKLAAEIFAVKIQDSNPIDLEKGLNEELKLIKRASIDRRTQSATSINDVQALLKERIKLDTLYITISDG